MLHGGSDHSRISSVYHVQAEANDKVEGLRETSAGARKMTEIQNLSIPESERILHQDSVLKRCTGRKVYWSPRQLILTDEGLYIAIGAEGGEG